MGRGRAKAKQTKVARELKYSTTGTDLDRLQQELSGSSPQPVNVAADDTDDEDEDDPYAEYGGDDEDYEDRDDEDEPAGRR